MEMSVCPSCYLRVSPSAVSRLTSAHNLSYGFPSHAPSIWSNVQLGNAGLSQSRLTSRTTLPREYRRRGGMMGATSVVGAPPVEVGREIDGGQKVGQTETVVIVGAGIAGLAIALGLHRVGVKSLVLEQASSMRQEGTSLGIFPNGWRALDALGVADQLRPQHTLITGGRFRAMDGKVLTEYDFTNEPGGPHELRGVMRRALLEALAEPLPPGTIRFNARVKGIHKPRELQGLTQLELEDGTTIATKVLVGCDGVRSVVGSWLGLRESSPVGQVGTRGMAVYEEGHAFESTFQQILGHGVRAGILPISSTAVYWFVAFNCSSKEKLRFLCTANGQWLAAHKFTDPQLIKEEALKLVEGWHSDILDCIHRTPLAVLSRSTLGDRWSLPLITPPAAKDGVTVAGDALHPMTPNIGQGGNLCLEDAVILVQKLSQALNVQAEAPAELKNLAAALSAYQKERWSRSFSLTMKAHMAGSFLGSNLAPICYIRDKFVVPKLIGATAFLSHTRFDCGKLPSPP